MGNRVLAEDQNAAKNVREKMRRIEKLKSKEKQKGEYDVLDNAYWHCGPMTYECEYCRAYRRIKIYYTQIRRLLCKLEIGLKQLTVIGLS